MLRVVAATGSVGASQLSSPASGLRNTWRLSNARAAGTSHNGYFLETQALAPASSAGVPAVLVNYVPEEVDHYPQKKAHTLGMQRPGCSLRGMDRPGGSGAPDVGVEAVPRRLLQRQHGRQQHRAPEQLRLRARRPAPSAPAARLFRLIQGRMSGPCTPTTPTRFHHDLTGAQREGATIGITSICYTLCSILHSSWQWLSACSAKPAEQDVAWLTLHRQPDTVAHSAERTCLVLHAGCTLQAARRRLGMLTCWWMAFTTMHPPSEQPHTNSGLFAKPATSHVARDLQAPALVHSPGATTLHMNACACVLTQEQRTLLCELPVCQFRNIRQHPASHASDHKPCKERRGEATKTGLE